jgi:hypothetical protein
MLAPYPYRIAERTSMRAPRQAGAVSLTTPMITTSTAISASYPGGKLKLTSHSDSTRVVSL